MTYWGHSDIFHSEYRL